MKINKVTFALVTLLCIGLTRLNAQNIVKDTDGNIYKTVKIGNQVWMAENMKTTKYNDGTAIPLVNDDNAWNALTKSAYCYYKNDISNKNIYGALYNWYTVDSKKLCPKGWHVPANAEWKTLTSYLGGESVAGGKLKEKGITHWNDPNTGATNSSGFTALGSGYHDHFAGFQNQSSFSYWWSTTESSTTSANKLETSFQEIAVSLSSNGKREGLSVRCLKD